MLTLEDLMLEKTQFLDNPEKLENDFIQGLRDMADFLENNPHLIQYYGGVAIHNFAEDVNELKVMATGGKWDKESSGGYFTLRKDFGPHHISINAIRDEVCERVEVGVETVEVYDPDAPKITVTRPVYEWNCPESILGVTE